MSAGLAGALLGVCTYVAVWLAAPNLHPLRHVTSAVLLVVGMVLAAKYA